MTRTFRRMTTVALAMAFFSCATTPKTPVGTKPDERSPDAAREETPWTTWSKKGTVGGLLVLKEIRDTLLHKNLHDPHVDYRGYRLIDCTKTNLRFRSADGTCTDPDRAWAGAAGVAFGRNVPPEFIDRDAKSKLMTPNPADVSRKLFTRDEFKPVGFLNMLAASWIQFMNHDWLTHGKNLEQDPHRVDGAGAASVVEKTAENPLSSDMYKRPFGRTTLNGVTHWWDGSQIYGSSQEEQDAVRAFQGGLLKTEKVNGRELLPQDRAFDAIRNKQNRGLEITGFRDNWWVGLSMLHHLFVREHNAIARELVRNHVRYDVRADVYHWKNGKEKLTMNAKDMDEHIFQTARLVNAAVMAKIHTVEWTPAILANDTLKKAMYANWYGLANPVSWIAFLKDVPGLNKTKWVQGIDPGYLIGGIVGDKRNDYGVPFSITEEFTSVYRLHSLLPEELNLRSPKNPSAVRKIAFLDSRNDKSYSLMAENDLSDWFYSFGTQNPGQLVLNNFPKFMQELPIPSHGVMDLGMVDILRDRERGVPRYNQFRRGINLKPIKRYTDFFNSDEPMDARKMQIVERLTELYGKNADGSDNVEMIDLLVGTLAEEVRPKNFGFGETMFQIFILMASRRLMADRFYTDNYNAEYYTKTGLNWIDRQGRLDQVIVRHMPELAKHLKGIETAFNPWKP